MLFALANADIEPSGKYEANVWPTITFICHPNTPNNIGIRFIKISLKYGSFWSIENLYLPNVLKNEGKTTTSCKKPPIVTPQAIG